MIGCLCWLYKKKFIELWTDQKRKSSSSYERIKNKQMTVLLYNQKARKWYTLIPEELFYVVIYLFSIYINSIRIIQC